MSTTTGSATEPRPPVRIEVIALSVLIALGAPVAVAVAFGSRTYEMVSLSTPDVATMVAAVLLEATASLSAIVTAGLLGYIVVTQRAGRRLNLGVAQRRARRWVEVTAPVWCASAFALTLVAATENNGRSASRITDPLFVVLLLNTTATQAWAIVTLVAAVVWAIVFFAGRWWAFSAAWLLTVAAAIPPAVTGQVSVGAGHDWATDVAILGAVAQIVALGAVSMAPVVGSRGEHPLHPRLTTVLLVVVMASTIALGVFFSVGLPSETPWTAAIGVAKAVVIPALIVLVRVSGRFPARLPMLMLPLVGVVVALDVAATRIPPPRYFLQQSIQENFLGYDLPDPVQWATILLPDRPNVLFLTLAIVAVAVYLARVRRLALRGIAWPVGRTVAWIGGWLVVLAATNTGIGMYSGGVFSVHMIAHMALNMLGPVLLVLGGVTTLLVRSLPAASSGAAIGIREWIVEAMRHSVTRLAVNPILVLIVFVGSFYVLYFTPLFDTAMRFHWGHQLMNLHFLVVGYLFYWQAIGVDRTPSPLPSVGKLGFVFAAMPFHAFFAIIVMGSTEVIAADFYSLLTVDWMTDRAADQYLGGGIAWAAGELPLLVVVIALGIQWAREDRRTSTREDRSEDASRTSALTNYNAMLAQLSAREDAPTERTPS